MDQGKSNRKAIVIWLALVVLLFIGAMLTGQEGAHGESVQTAMRDAVLHDTNKVSLFGLMNVNPAFISAIIMTAVLLIAAALIRIFVIPGFTEVPGRFQLILETAVGYFTDLAKKHCPEKSNLLGGYIFAAGAYIFTSTLFELLGVQVISTEGASISLPAPISDINAAIAMGCMSYLFIMFGGVLGNGVKGVGYTLKEYSLPISMSFRLFGALLSGLLVTELVYHTIYLSVVLPVVVAVMFTLLHAVIQAYVLTLLVSIYFGEVSEPHKKKKSKAVKDTEAAAEGRAA